MDKEHLHEQRPSRDDEFEVKVIGDLTALADREVQIVLSKFGVRDIAIALQGEDEDLRERIFGNMSARVRSLLEEHTAQLGQVDAGETKAVRDRMVTEAQQAIAAARRIKSVSGASPSTAQVSARLAATPFHKLRLEEVAEVLRDLAAIARRDGILALEAAATATDTDEEMLRQGIQLAVDGTEPELIQTMLEVRRPTLVRYHETRYRLMVEGLLSIRWNDHPFLANLRMRNCYISDEYADPASRSVQDLKDQLGDTPASQLDLGGTRLLIVGMAFIARELKSAAPLADLVPCIDDDLLAHGLQMVIDNEDDGLIRSALEARAKRLLCRRETRYRMVSEGIMLIQGGCRPEEMVGKLRVFLED